MHFSRFTKISILLLVVAAITGFNRNLFSWGLFNFFTDTTYSEKGMQEALTFNPDRDILYLPSLKDKKLFQAVKDLSITRRREVRKYIYLYLTSGRPYLISSIEKSYFYKDIIDEIIKEEKNVPEDLALLPLLESGFNPWAVSSSRATGLWQFMTNTSTPLGLKSNRWVEERRDIEKSTRAALRHLRNLYKTFGNWELTLAAYNGGGGHVRRAMISSGKKDFWSMAEAGVLRQETCEYVPRYLAMLLIYRNQGLFDIKDEIEIPETDKTTMIELKYPVNMHHVSRYSGIDMETLRRYNPELNRNITPPYERNYEIRIPHDGARKLKEMEKHLYRVKFRHVKRYRIRRGDCLTRIAARHKKKLVTSSALTALRTLTS